MAGVAAPAFVEHKITQRPVVMFSKSYCPESKKIKKLLKGLCLTVQVLNQVLLLAWITLKFLFSKLIFATFDLSVIVMFPICFIIDRVVS